MINAWGKGNAPLIRPSGCDSWRFFIYSLPLDSKVVREASCVDKRECDFAGRHRYFGRDQFKVTQFELDLASESCLFTRRVRAAGYRRRKLADRAQANISRHSRVFNTSEHRQEQRKRQKQETERTILNVQHGCFRVRDGSRFTGTVSYLKLSFRPELAARRQRQDRCAHRGLMIVAVPGVVA